MIASGYNIEWTSHRWQMLPNAEPTRRWTNESVTVGLKRWSRRFFRQSPVARAAHCIVISSVYIDIADTTGTAYPVTSAQNIGSEHVSSYLVAFHGILNPSEHRLVSHFSTKGSEFATARPLNRFPALHASKQRHRLLE